MKKNTFIVLISLLAFGCNKDNINEESSETLGNKSYVMDYVDIEQQLRYADPCNNCVSARLLAISDWDIKSISFGKNKDFTLITNKTSLKGNYEEANNGKDLVLFFPDEKDVLSFKVREKTQKTLKLDLDWDDKTYIPSSYTLIFHFKRI